VTVISAVSGAVKARRILIKLRKRWRDKAQKTRAAPRFPAARPGGKLTLPLRGLIAEDILIRRFFDGFRNSGFSHAGAL